MNEALLRKKRSSKSFSCDGPLNNTRSMGKNKMRNGKNRLKYFKISLRKMEQICMSIMHGVNYCAKSISICPCRCEDESMRKGGREKGEIQRSQRQVQKETKKREASYLTFLNLNHK